MRDLMLTDHLEALLNQKWLRSALEHLGNRQGSNSISKKQWKNGTSKENYYHQQPLLKEATMINPAAANHREVGLALQL